MRTNGLSALGKMSYAAHLALYPVVGGTAFFVISNWSKSSAAKEKQQEIDFVSKCGKNDLRPQSTLKNKDSSERTVFYQSLSPMYRHWKWELNPFLSARRERATTALCLVE